MPPRKRRMTRTQADLPPMPDSDRHKFGWCMDGNDDMCRYQYRSTLTGALYTCSCDCHREETV